MPNRPSSYPYWCTQNPAGLSTPPTSLVETGWSAGEAPAAENVNALFNSIGNWLAFLDQGEASTLLTTTLDPSVRLLSDADLSWALGTTTLSWTGPLYVAIPGQPNANNTIAAGSVSIPNGSLAYVTANVPLTLTATLSSGSSTLTSVTYPDLVSVGMGVSGAGIASGTTVSSVDAADGTVTLSAAATASGTAQSVTFTSSGTLAVSVATASSFVPSANTVVIAVATKTTVHVGINASVSRLHDGETKQLGENGFVCISRPTAGAALTQGQAVYVSQGATDTDAQGNSTGRTAGQVYPADASATYPARNGVAGFAVSSGASGAAVQIVSEGVLSGLSGLTPGAIYWLSPTTPGALTATQPTASGQWAVPLGTALSATRLLINPAAAAMAKNVSQNLTLGGTLTANSVVSAQGFRQQVNMGFFASAAGNTVTGQYFARQLVNQNGSFTSIAYWTAEQAGSILSLKVSTDTYFANTITTGLTVLRNQVGSAATYGSNNLLYFSGTSIATSNSFAFWQNAAKGSQPFKQSDMIALSVTIQGTPAYNNNNVAVRLQADMTVEMAA